QRESRRSPEGDHGGRKDRHHRRAHARPAEGKGQVMRNLATVGRRAFLAAGAASFAAAGIAWAAQDARLRKIIDTADRKPQDKARDRYRHPYQSLLFWGLKPGITVIDISPGGGW